MDIQSSPDSEHEQELDKEEVERLSGIMEVNMSPLHSKDALNPVDNQVNQFKEKLLAKVAPSAENGFGVLNFKKSL